MLSVSWFAPEWTVFLPLIFLFPGKKYLIFLLSILCTSVFLLSTLVLAVQTVDYVLYVVYVLSINILLAEIVSVGD